MLAVSACGGGDDAFDDLGSSDNDNDGDIEDIGDLGDLGDLGDIDGLEDLNLPAGVLEEVLEELSDEGIELDINNDGGGFTVSNDEGDFSMGTDLDPPDWLPSGFPLPDDISIQGHGDEDDQQSLLAIHEGDLNVVAERDRLADWFGSNGYDLLLDDTTNGQLSMAAVSSDGEVVDVAARGNTFTIEISRRDITFDQQDAAEVIEGTGTATINIDGDSYTVDGTCFVQGAEYRFEHSAPDGSTSASVNVYAVTEPPSGSAFFMQIGEGEFVQYIVNFPMGNGNEPTVSTGELDFGVSGELIDTMGSGTVEGSFAVECSG